MAKLVSVNVGLPRDVTLRGKVERTRTGLAIAIPTKRNSILISIAGKAAKCGTDS